MAILGAGEPIPADISIRKMIEKYRPRKLQWIEHIKELKWQIKKQMSLINVQVLYPLVN